MDVVKLYIKNDYLCAGRISDLLGYSHVIGMKMGDQDNVNIPHFPAVLLQKIPKGRKATCPSGIKEQRSCPSGDQISVCI